MTNTSNTPTDIALDRAERLTIFKYFIGILVTIGIVALMCSGFVLLLKGDEKPARSSDEDDITETPDAEELAVIMTATAGAIMTSGTANPVQQPATPIASALPPGGMSGVTPTVVAAAVTPASSGAQTCAVPAGWVAYEVVNGDTLSGIAEALGTTAEALAAANCIADTDEILVGQQLYVPAAVSSGAVSSGTCATAWFFTFNADVIEPTQSCPLPPVQVEARGLNFEGGRVYRYEALPGVPNATPTLYVIYNTGTWEAYVDIWNNATPATDPAIVPPSNFYQPAGAIGALWRENPTIREALGWALESNSVPFTGRIQLPEGSQTYMYIDHGVLGLVLRLDSPVSGEKTWQVVGGY